MFTRSLAHLAKSGVRVNALCPEVQLLFVELCAWARLTDFHPCLLLVCFSPVFLSPPPPEGLTV